MVTREWLAGNGRPVAGAGWSPHPIAPDRAGTTEAAGGVQRQVRCGPSAVAQARPTPAARSGLTVAGSAPSWHADEAADRRVAEQDTQDPRVPRARVPGGGVVRSRARPAGGGWPGGGVPRWTGDPAL